MLPVGFVSLFDNLSQEAPAAIAGRRQFENVAAAVSAAYIFRGKLGRNFVTLGVSDRVK
jgi:hypothetical protein